jgi:hypothetical protein
MIDLQIFTDSSQKKLPKALLPNMPELFQEDLKVIQHSKINDKESLFEYLEYFYKLKIESLLRKNKDIDILELYSIIRSF